CRIGRQKLRALWDLLGRAPGEVALFPKGIFEAGSFTLDLAARLRFRRHIAIQHTLPRALPPRTSVRHLGGLIPGLGLWWWRQELGPRWARSLGPHLTVAVSEAVRKRLIENYRFPARKVVTIRTGVDAGRYRPSPELRQAARSRWNIPPGALVFGAVGRLDPMKGYDVALRALRGLRDGFPDQDLRLVLVGTGIAEEPLRAEAARLGVEAAVVFAGFEPRPWEVYPAFDVFLMPSRVEGLPLSLLEAMAAGCTPVAMGVGGIPEILSHPGLGWLVEPGDEAGFSQAMRAALEVGPEQLTVRAGSARAHVVAHFNEQIQFGLLADCIEEGGRRPAGHLGRAPRRPAAATAP
ncbi:MAG TPA: glycosyltransferase, partial [Candidatus Sulfotelmatobacter sp.]|nr:glycosyltransferase [Candidatus Sulfotelmatobacter sp.]